MACSEPNWGVYLLCCADGTLYTGMTNRLQQRLARHRAGQASRYTRARLPVTLVYWEDCSDRSSALRREAAIKKLDRRAKLRLIEVMVQRELKIK
ncbi:GIY-YIG nuclease family protein [Chitinimonas lacunae]|uniref:GIY-YIG nuclease family protein n=1 Tax=Chitinimonas lacunae TaxID=1963018 RepID=A0ABV8MQA3_9NEIS